MVLYEKVVEYNSFIVFTARKRLGSSVFLVDLDTVDNMKGLVKVVLVR